MSTKKTPRESANKDTIPTSWIVAGIGFLLAIVLMIVVVVNRSTASSLKIESKKVHHPNG